MELGKAQKDPCFEKILLFTRYHLSYGFVKVHVYLARGSTYIYILYLHITDCVSIWSTVHSHPSEGSSLSPDLCRCIQPTLDLITSLRSTNLSWGQKNAGKECKSWRKITLPTELWDLNMLWNVPVLREVSIVRSHVGIIWIYHGVLSTHQDIYCSASNTDCSRRTGPTMAHPCWPSFSWAHLAFHSQSVPASAVSDETWGQLIGLHKDPYGDTWCSIVHLLLTPKSRILLCRATLVSLTLLPSMDVFLFSAVQ